MCVIFVILIFVWIKFNGILGLIINYGIGFVWEIYLWLLNFKMFFVCYVKVGGVLIFFVFKFVLRWNVWSFVGIFYDGMYVRLWVNVRNVVMCKIGRIGLLMNGLIRIGVKIGDFWYYKGVIVCV